MVHLSGLKCLQDKQQSKKVPLIIFSGTFILYLCGFSAQIIGIAPKNDNAARTRRAI